MAAVIAFLLGLVSGGPPQQDAAAAYRAGEFQRAFAAYSRELEAGPARGDLLYNLGNCAYRLGRHAEAVLYYQRARLRLPGDREVRANLRLAQRELGVRPDPLRPDLGDRLRALDGPWLLLAACVLQCAGLVLLVLCGSRAARGAGVLLLITGLAAGARLVHGACFPESVRAVVLEERIDIRSEPHAELLPGFQLPAGELVVVAEGSDRWLRVVHPRGSGWTSRTGVGVID